eukprot:COSAG01_NODE_38245_length_492_cov_0.704835_1_plen_35_part_10
MFCDGDTDTYNAEQVGFSLGSNYLTKYVGEEGGEG